MLVDPSNRVVADTVEREWNEKLRVMAETREERVLPASLRDGR